MHVFVSLRCVSFRYPVGESSPAWPVCWPQNCLFFCALLLLLLPLLRLPRAVWSADVLYLVEVVMVVMVNGDHDDDDGGDGGGNCTGDIIDGDGGRLSDGVKSGVLQRKTRGDNRKSDGYG